MSLQVVDVKFQAADACEIAKWIWFLHAKSISAKMWLSSGFNTFEFSPQGRDLPSQWLSLNSCGVKAVVLNGLLDCVFIIACTSGFPHLAGRLCCSRLVPVGLSLTFTMRLCGSIRCTCLCALPPDQPGHSSGSLALWLLIRWGHLAEWKGGREESEGRVPTYLLGSLSVDSPRAGYIPPLKSSCPVHQLLSQNSLSL